MYFGFYVVIELFPEGAQWWEFPTIMLMAFAFLGALLLAARKIDG